MLHISNKFRTIVSVCAVMMLAGSMSVSAQDDQVRSLINGQKYKIEGVVIAKDGDNFLLRDETGVSSRIVISPNTSIKSNSFWGSGDRYAAASIVRGLRLKAEGRGGADGSLAATKVRFDKSDLEVAQTVESRVAPAEERLTAQEENAKRVSGQIDELLAISNAARGGAKAAQETADAAVAGINATNTRISAIDEYVVRNTATVNFRVGSSKLSPEAKQQLDEVAAATQSLKGFVLEVTGFASSDGDPKANKLLSDRRAKAVKDYLIMTHNIPLRRFGNSYGYGESQAVADNSTREGREQNRRVEVKILVSRGLNQNVEVRPAPATTDDGTK
jgi:outer membrane protein OmpA-like peptidoglycan-associated protein